MLVHSECVVDICVNAIKNTDLNPDVLIIAGFIHDLGRKIDKDRHHEIGVGFLDKFIEEFPEYVKLREDIADCILNHRTNGNPNTVYGRIIQAADKVAKHHQRWLDYKAKKEK